MNNLNQNHKRLIFQYHSYPNEKIFNINKEPHQIKN